MTNLTAAVLSAQLERWDHLVASRMDVDSTYRRLLSPVFGRRPIEGWAGYQCWFATASCPEGSRTRVLERVRSSFGVDARGVWPAMNTQAALVGDFGTAGECPIAEALADNVIMLPTSSDMPMAEVGYVAESLDAALSFVGVR